MTRATRERNIKDANGDIIDHLHNHIHLTNCIHLKNHMHRNSPTHDNISISRDLSALQRSRSLRDPSTSPPLWHSPFITDIHSRQSHKDATVHDRRWSDGRSGRRMSLGSSPAPMAILASSKVFPGEITAHSVHSSKNKIQKGKQICREGCDQNLIKGDLISSNNGRPVEPEVNAIAQDAGSGNRKSKDRKNNKHKEGKNRPDVYLKTLSEQLHDISMDSDGVATSHVQINAKSTSHGTRIRSNCSGLSRVKKRKLKGARRYRGSVGSRDTASVYSEFSVASNSFAHSFEPRMFNGMDQGKGNFSGENIVTRDSKNACGIPLNWSIIHHRGKTILDKAGRSFSCGLADSRAKKDEFLSPGKGVSDMSFASDRTSPSIKSNAEALPLLIEAPGSQVSSEQVASAHEYSGELGIFSDHLPKHDIDSDFVSEARSGERAKYEGHSHHRHQNLTQKYTPRTFRDLVGQNLVTQALANAVAKRKVGLLYLFYGPHGTGKTSCARIFARALNCQSHEYRKPCGYCNFCTAHVKGQSRYIREVGPVCNFDFGDIMDLLENMIVSNLPSQYRIFIFDDCDTLSPDSWSALSKVIERAPRRIVFIFVSSNLDCLPHIIMSRCQKFFFPKLRDADIISSLETITIKEGIEIDWDALKLIASRSDGSLRDAEMTLEQLSLLGERISVALVQELVGLICDEKLVDLLDLALSADTVNTVKNLREIMETGVDPLALMTQIATIITDILAGIYDFSSQRLRKKFFQHPTLSKEHMEKLRQALKILSEAEKQLRMSNEKLTWLTAALLQLAPDQQYMLPTSPNTCLNQSPSALSGAGGRDKSRKSYSEHGEMTIDERVLSKNLKNENPDAGNAIYCNGGKMKGKHIDRKTISGTESASQQTLGLSSDASRVKRKHMSCRSLKEIEEVWLEALHMIPSDNLKEFMSREGKLISVSFGAAPTVQLMFESHLSKSKAEKFREQILQAFESVIGYPVIIEIRCDVGNSSKERDLHGVHHAIHFQPLNSESLEMRSEIVEIADSPRAARTNEPVIKGTDSAGSGSHKRSITTTRNFGEQNRSHSLVRGKVSLANVIQQTEGWSRRKAISIAEKLEQENLRLEPRSRSLLCWKASKLTRPKISRFKKHRKRKPRSMLKQLVPCGRCLSSKSEKRSNS